MKKMINISSYARLRVALTEREREKGGIQKEREREEKDRYRNIERYRDKGRDRQIKRVRGREKNDLAIYRGQSAPILQPGTRIY